MTTLSDSLLNRKTIRKYSSADINDEMLRDLLSKGCRASTTGNMQVYSIIITRDIARKRNLHHVILTRIWLYVLGCFDFCADFNRFTRWCRQRRAEPGYDNFLSFITGAIDSLLVAQTVCIAAEEKGIGNLLPGNNNLHGSQNN